MARKRTERYADEWFEDVWFPQQSRWAGIPKGGLLMLGRNIRVVCCVAVMSLGFASAAVRADPVQGYECGFQSSEAVAAAIREAVERGEIPDPATRRLPVVRSRRSPPRPTAAGVPTMTTDDIFIFEDSGDLLVGTFSVGQFVNLMAEASNELMVAHGDEFDFIGLFLNFVPDPESQIGGAVYFIIENDVSGIGLGPENRRASLGVAGENIEGWVSMWNAARWPEGASGGITQLVLGQEFEHRFAMFVDGLTGGRSLQGTGSGCGRAKHWNFRVDGQGSGMEIPEWVGSSPAIRIRGPNNSPLSFNTDIGMFSSATGAVFSYPDLYLMGYVSPEEMDAGASELRYLDDNANCQSPYSGSISTWSSADIIASNGPRVPNSTQAQKHFRTAWVMIHRPGSPPTSSDLNHVVNILNQWSETFAWSTLGRGTMDNTLPPRCAKNQDCDDADPCNGIETCDSNNGRCVVAFTDCNENGNDDICDLSDCGGDPACSDCNANGVPDHCDLFANFVAASPVLSPVVGGQTLSFEFSSAPERAGDVTFSFAASAGLGESTSGIEVQVNGQSIGSVFGFDGQTCPFTPDTAELILTAAEFDAIPSVGTYAIALIPFGNINFCLQTSFVTVAVRYETPTGADCNKNNIPDDCEPDCQPNGIPDECEIADGSVGDCQPNGVPDTCESITDCNNDQLPDECQLQDNDCNGNGIPDECEPDTDCNDNARADICDLADGTSPDCNENATPDECDVVSGKSFDHNENGIPDECDPPCTSNADCADDSVCTFDVCGHNVCTHTSARYGDVAGQQGSCGPDDTVDLSDILAVLNGFQAIFADGCELSNVDITSKPNSCSLDGTIDLFDILSVLDAFQGDDHCCGDGR